MFQGKMVTCEVCGSEEFEKHEGFMYCAVCQTQSQDYHEQEYEYHDHEMNLSRRQKPQVTAVKSTKQKVYDDGLWTTWEAFNYILYGMSEEMKKCGVSEEFEEMVFKIWAAYLRECKAAFTSKFEEKVPKLRFRFKQRDARILYNTDVTSAAARKRKLRSRSCSSKVSQTSDSTQSKRSLAVQRKKVIAVDYQDYLSLSVQSNVSLADETLESLGRSSELETSEDSSDDNESVMKSFKHMFSTKDFKQYKNSYNSKRIKVQARDKANKDITCPGKNRLLSIIHLALLLTESHIQLSDLLRGRSRSSMLNSIGGAVRYKRCILVRMGSPTHFIFQDVKFPRKDFSYIEVISDALMPTHLRQRRITGQLACLLKIRKIPTPDTNTLVDRYCQDFNLPKQIAELSKKILLDFIPSATVPRSKTPLPSYEAWAMVSIIFVLKVLLGLNDKTEVFLSDLAREINSEWQKFIECRKTFLKTFHYPTQEQLCGSSLQGSKMFLDVLMKESKDEYRKDRCIPYPRYYMEEKFLSGIKQVLNALSRSQNVASFEFQPSLVPQTSHVETIMRNLSERATRDAGEDGAIQNSSAPYPGDILKQNFTNCDVEYALDPRSYMDLLDDNSEIFTKFGVSRDPSADDSPEKNNPNAEILTDCSTRYWVFHFSDTASGHLKNFKEEILEKTPGSFQWLLTECARMLEMNVRDVYNELVRLEKELSPGLRARDRRGSRGPRGPRPSASSQS